MTSGGPAPGSRRERFVILGDNLLTLRIVESLRRQGGSYPVDVVVVVPDEQGPQVARIAAVPGVRVLVRPGPDDDATFLDAGVVGATAVALVDREDVTNIHRALRVQELDPGVRLVVRLFNVALGRRIRALLPRATVLSVSHTAAPSFVTAAIGRAVRQHVRTSGRTFVIAGRAEVPPEQIVCGLAADSAVGSGRDPVLLPDDDAAADYVLAVADSPRRGSDRIGEPLRDRVRVVLDRILSRLRGGLTRRLARAALGLLVLLAVGTVAFAVLGGLSLGDAVYVAVLDAAGAAQPDPTLPTPVRVVQALVTLVGIAIIPLVTAVVVDSAVSARVVGTTLRRRPRVDHVVVVGLGNVGLRIVEQLRERGVGVIGVDRDESGDGVAAVRRLGVPVVVGDATRRATLEQASVGTSRALVAVSRDDVTNLEAALVARTGRARLRVVLRLRDDDLARRIERTAEIAISRSVSFVAAPVFAAALRDGQVLATVPVGRRVLLMAEVSVGRASWLAGLPGAAAAATGEVRVVGVYLGAAPDAVLEMPPRAQRRLKVGDRLLVVATRSGFGEVLAGCAARIRE